MDNDVRSSKIYICLTVISLITAVIGKILTMGIVTVVFLGFFYIYAYLFMKAGLSFAKSSVKKNNILFALFCLSLITFACTFSDLFTEFNITFLFKESLITSFLAFVLNCCSMCAIFDIYGFYHPKVGNHEVEVTSTTCENCYQKLDKEYSVCPNCNQPIIKRTIIVEDHKRGERTFELIVLIIILFTVLYYACCYFSFSMLSTGEQFGYDIYNFIYKLNIPFYMPILVSAVLLFIGRFVYSSSKIIKYCFWILLCIISFYYIKLMFS